MEQKTKYEENIHHLCVDNICVNNVIDITNNSCVLILWS